ncbi:MAG TPA: hypothetical protein VE779_03290, partial [Candidatus Angelobacter sp.]|nr:hypothetical protein [Candidatus Angelobacter sp.]
MAFEPFQSELFPALDPARHCLILSVDDEPCVLYGRLRLLQSAGYWGLCASDGVQALQVFANNSVDLVLPDYRKGQYPKLL